MEAAEATARAARLDRLAADLELAERQCPDMAESASQILQRVRSRFSPEVWSGPAAERAFAGLQAVSAQAVWVRHEIAQVEELAHCAGEAAKEVAETLRRAAQNGAARLVDDAAAGWPAARRVPPRDPVPPPRAEVPPPPGAGTGFVGLNLVEADSLQADLAHLLDWADGMSMAFEDNVHSRLVAALYELGQDVPGTPKALTDLSWVHVSDRLRLMGGWGRDTAADLKRRIEVFGAVDRAVASSMVTATFLFDSPAAATSAAKGDSAVIRSILKKDRSGGPLPGPQDHVAALRSLLEGSEERFYDTAYAATALNDVGPKRVRELMALAERAGPETVARLYSLIGSASRSRSLDKKVEAALLADPRLNELAESDALLSADFAAKAASTLLDPNRPSEDRMGIEGPDRDNLAAAQHLMTRYQISSMVDPARLAGIAGNPFLPPDAVADMLRLATLAQANLSDAANTLDGILAHLDRCSKQSKRVLAKAVVIHMEHLADVIDAGDVGGEEATRTVEGIHVLMGDREARRTIVDGAGALAAKRFGSAASELATVMADNPGIGSYEAFAKLQGDSDDLVEVGKVLQALADWEGEGASELPGLLAAGFGLSLAAAGTVFTGGGMSIALAGAGTATDLVAGGAEASAKESAEHKRRVHAENIREVAQHFVIASLLLNPGPPPLWDALVESPPNPRTYTRLVVNGTFVVPEPGTPAWKELQDWLDKGNKKLNNAVNAMLDRANFGL